MKRASLLLLLLACAGRQSIDAIGNGADAGSGIDSAAPTEVVADGGVVPVSNCPASPFARAEVVACGLPAKSELFAVDTVGGPIHYWLIEPSGITRVDETGAWTRMVERPIGDPSSRDHTLGFSGGAILYSEDPGDCSSCVPGVRIFGARASSAKTLGTVYTNLPLAQFVCEPDGACLYSDAGDDAAWALSTIGPAWSASSPNSISVALLRFSSFSALEWQPVAIGGKGTWGIALSLYLLDDKLPGYTAYLVRQGQPPASPVNIGYIQSTAKLADLVARSTFDDAAAYIPDDSSGTSTKIARVPLSGPITYLPNTDGRWTRIRAIGSYLYGLRANALVRVDPKSLAETSVIETVLTPLTNPGPVVGNGMAQYITFDVTSNGTPTRVLAKLK